MISISPPKTANQKSFFDTYLTGLSGIRNKGSITRELNMDQGQNIEEAINKFKADISGGNQQQQQQPQQQQQQPQQPQQQNIQQQQKDSTEQSGDRKRKRDTDGPDLDLAWNEFAGMPAEKQRLTMDSIVSTVDTLQKENKKFQEVEKQLKELKDQWTASTKKELLEILEINAKNSANPNQKVEAPQFFEQLTPAAQRELVQFTKQINTGQLVAVAGEGVGNYQQQMNHVLMSHASGNRSFNAPRTASGPPNFFDRLTGTVSVAPVAQQQQPRYLDNFTSPSPSTDSYWGGRTLGSNDLSMFMSKLDHQSEPVNKPGSTTVIDPMSMP